MSSYRVECFREMHAGRMTVPDSIYILKTGLEVATAYHKERK